jgi:hypothetical protein
VIAREKPEEAEERKLEGVKKTNGCANAIANDREKYRPGHAG